MKFFATCGRGIEETLADELRVIGAEEVSVGRGGAHFEGDRSTLYRANLWLRSAIRVLQPIQEFEATSTDELYDAVREIDWSEIMTVSHTLAVDCNVRSSKITHSKYAALRVKDAICDQFLDRMNKRPSVDVENPLVGLNLHIFKDQATLSLDSSVQSLHKRGYRGQLHKAALNEALAATLVLLSGWKGEVPLIDPMCGSGTIPIEAAWMALKRPPGLTRKRFGFQSWLDFDRPLWNRVRDEAREGVLKEMPISIHGSDHRNDVLRLAEENARAAGIGNHLEFRNQDLFTFAPDSDSGVIICNPPYGERIGEEDELRPLYRRLGELVRANPSWTVWVLSGNARLCQEIGEEPREEKAIYNGRIPCRFLKFTSNPR